MLYTKTDVSYHIYLEWNETLLVKHIWKDYGLNAGPEAMGWLAGARPPPTSLISRAGYYNLQGDRRHKAFIFWGTPRF